MNKHAIHRHVRAILPATLLLIVVGLGWYRIAYPCQGDACLAQMIVKPSPLPPPPPPPSLPSFPDILTPLDPTGVMICTQGQVCGIDQWDFCEGLPPLNPACTASARRLADGRCQWAVSCNGIICQTDQGVSNYGCTCEMAIARTCITQQSTSSMRNSSASSGGASSLSCPVFPEWNPDPSQCVVVPFVANNACTYMIYCRGAECSPDEFPDVLTGQAQCHCADLLAGRCTPSSAPSSGGGSSAGGRISSTGGQFSSGQQSSGGNPTSSASSCPPYREHFKPPEGKRWECPEDLCQPCILVDIYSHSVSSASTGRSASTVSAPSSAIQPCVPGGPVSSVASSRGGAELRTGGGLRGGGLGIENPMEGPTVLDYVPTNEYLSVHQNVCRLTLCSGVLGAHGICQSLTQSDMWEHHCPEGFVLRENRDDDPEPRGKLCTTVDGCPGRTYVCDRVTKLDGLCSCDADPMTYLERVMTCDIKPVSYDTCRCLSWRNDISGEIAACGLRPECGITASASSLSSSSAAVPCSSISFSSRSSSSQSSVSLSSSLFSSSRSGLVLVSRSSQNGDISSSNSTAAAGGVLPLRGGQLSIGGGNIQKRSAAAFSEHSYISAGALDVFENSDGSVVLDDSTVDGAESLGTLHGASCGNGIIERGLGEECDMGPANSNTIPNRCRINCQMARLGDGVVDSGETCQMEGGCTKSITDPDNHGAMPSATELPQDQAVLQDQWLTASVQSLLPPSAIPVVHGSITQVARPLRTKLPNSGPEILLFVSMGAALGYAGVRRR